MSLLVVAAFIVTPAIASPPTESKSVTMATTTEPTTTTVFSWQSERRLPGRVQPEGQQGRKT